MSPTVRTIILTLVVLSFASLGNLSAQLISFNSQFTNASGTVAPGSQYDFFGNQSQPVSLQNFALNITAPIDETVPYSSTVIAPGQSTPFATGSLLIKEADSSVDMFTFQVTNPSITSFTIWALDDNAPESQGFQNSALSLRVNSSTPVTVTTPLDAGGVNRWTEFTITGASTSDVFTLNATSSSSHVPGVGGVTFSAVPEPSTYILFGLGALALVVGVRRRAKA